MSFKPSKSSLLALALMLVEILVIWLWPVTRVGVAYMAQSDNFKNEAIGEILPGMKMEEEFTVYDDNFAALDILMATYARINTSHVTFQLFEGEQEIAKQTISTKSVRDNAMHTFKFDSLENSKDKTYKLVLTSEDAVPGNAITLWVNPWQFAGGAFYINGVKQNLNMIIVSRHAISGFGYLNMAFKRISVNQAAVVNIYTLYLLFASILFVVNSIMITLVQLVRLPEKKI